MDHNIFPGSHPGGKKYFAAQSGKKPDQFVFFLPICNSRFQDLRIAIIIAKKKAAIEAYSFRYRFFKLSQAWYLIFFQYNISLKNSMKSFLKTATRRLNIFCNFFQFGSNNVRHERRTLNHLIRQTNNRADRHHERLYRLAYRYFEGRFGYRPGNCRKVVHSVKM